MSVEGVDYTGGASVSALVAAGKKFACRYGGAGGSWKHLTPTEAKALIAAGVAIVANVEGAQSGLLNGFSEGAEWARLAQTHFVACGMPPDRPIYLSVDFDVTSGQWPAVREALRGAASVLGAARVGVYGGRRAIEWARRDGVAQWFWQTYAWSGGIWVPGNHIEQYRNGVSLAGTTVDLDRALMSDYGQWKIGDEGEDMDTVITHNLGWRLQAITAGDETIVVPADAAIGAPGFTEINHPQVQLNRLEQKVAALSTPQPAPVDIAALVAALRPELDAAAERAVRKVLGTLDGATPQG